MAGFKIVKIVAIAALTIGVFGTLIVALWNWLMPNLFGLPMINFSQALGLFVLCRILTGGLRFGNGSGSGHWAAKREMMQNWRNMSSEEREQMKQEWKTDWRERCNSRRPIGFNRPNTNDPKEPTQDAPNAVKSKDFI
jgi:hypothetical protein